MAEPPRRAEIPLRRRACARRLLVVPLRGIEEPAVLRRHAQDDRIHPCEIHVTKAEKLWLCGCSAPAISRSATGPTRRCSGRVRSALRYSSPRTSDLPARCPRGTSPLWLRPSPAR